jgi:hypothetical protein
MNCVLFVGTRPTFVTVDEVWESVGYIWQHLDRNQVDTPELCSNSTADYNDSTSSKKHHLWCPSRQMTGTGTPSLNWVFPCQSFARLPETVRRTPAPMGMGGYVARQGHGSFSHGLRPQAFMSSELDLWRVAVGSCHTRWVRNILRERTNLKTESRKRIIKKTGGRLGEFYRSELAAKSRASAGAFPFVRPSTSA